MLCSYFMGLNLSNQQIASELNLSVTQAHEMAMRFREGIADHQHSVVLNGEVECDEVYVIAGHKGEYARDEDGDGFHEIHVNTMEGVWSLLQSWLRPHRGVSQENLPLYRAFFELTHNLRKREQALFESLITVLINPST